MNMYSYFSYYNNYRIDRPYKNRPEGSLTDTKEPLSFLVSMVLGQLPTLT